MARVTVEDCLEKMNNRFSLVALVAKRVRQFLSGDQPLVEANNKHVVNALREVAAGELTGNLSKDEMSLQLENFFNKSATVEENNQELNNEDESSL